MISLAAVFVSLLISHHATISEGLKSSIRQRTVEMNRLQKRIEAAVGCNVNVCFEFDGSGSVTNQEFTNQIKFVHDVISIIAVDNQVEIAAGQCSTVLSPIYALTANVPGVLQAIDGINQLGGQSFVVGCLSYCFSQLFRRRGEALHIVLLADGRRNIGSDAARRADFFRSIGGKVSVVGAGFTDDTQLLNVAGGNPNYVYQIDSFLDVLELQNIIEPLVLQIFVR